MRSARWAFLALTTAIAFDAGAVPNTVLVTDYGDAGPGDCNTTCTLRDAITVALAAVPVKSVTFSSSPGWPQTITLAQGQLGINNVSGSTLLIVGPGAEKLAISASTLNRVLQVSGGNVDITALTLRDGKVTGTSPGTEPSGSGNPGQGGGAAIGGCIEVDAGATLTLQLSDIRNCVAQGGTGGTGGTGTGGTLAGPGGSGGAGGTASGGAIYSAGALTLLRSSVVNASATSGAGGNGGEGGSGTFGTGAGGNAGTAGSAAGGGVAIASGGSLLIRNSTLAAATATAGNGGVGGNGGTLTSSGNGGNGGNVFGGVVYVGSSVVVADFEFATLANGTVLAGVGGPPGSIGITIGMGGQAGVARAAGTYATGPNTAIFTSSVIVGSGGASLCFGSVGVDSGSVNLDQDSSCTGFTLHDTLAHVLAPLNLATTHWPGYEPVFHSAIVDAAASCTQIGGVVAVTNDQHGTLRPQGAKCDLGAIESDYLFANGFS